MSERGSLAAQGGAARCVRGALGAPARAEGSAGPSCSPRRPREQTPALKAWPDLPALRQRTPLLTGKQAWPPRGAHRSADRRAPSPSVGLRGGEDGLFHPVHLRRRRSASKPRNELRCRQPLHGDLGPRRKAAEPLQHPEQKPCPPQPCAPCSHLCCLLWMPPAPRLSRWPASRSRSRVP